MRQFTTEEIQARFEQLPIEVQQAATSTEVQDKIRAISDRHGLHIDQFGELVEEIGLVMLGLQRSAMFVPDLVSRLSVTQKEAESIAADVSADIFSAIRKHLQDIDARAEQEELQATTVPHLEQAGDMEILADAGHPEAPTAIVKTPAALSVASKKPYVEPLVDRLLAGPVGQTAQKAVVAPASPAPTAPAATAPTQTPARPKIDPYHEPV